MMLRGYGTAVGCSVRLSDIHGLILSYGEFAEFFSKWDGKLRMLRSLRLSARTLPDLSSS